MTKKILTGYAVKWGVPSHKIGNRFFEVFQKGAFAESLKMNDIRALWSHDTSTILGRTKNGTLEVYEDRIGLRFKLELPNTTIGNDAFESIQRGDVDGVSFGFRMIEQEWDKLSNGSLLRIVCKASLNEISPVAFPTHPSGTITAYTSENKYVESRRKELIKQLQREELLYLTQKISS